MYLTWQKDIQNEKKKIQNVKYAKKNPKNYKKKIEYLQRSMCVCVRVLVFQ